MTAARRAAALVACGLLCALPASRASAAQDVEWRSNLTAALREAEKGHRPLLLEFWTSWCVPCRTMESDFWPDPVVAGLARKFVSVKIDGDRAPGHLARYRVGSFPTLVFLDPWGHEMVRLSGFSRRDIMTLLKELPGDFSPIAAAHARAASGRGSLEALQALGRFYGDHGIHPMSIDFYDKALKTDEAKGNPAVTVELLTTIGWGRLQMEDHRRAKASFQRCLKEKGGPYADFDRTLYGLFRACLALGERREAGEVFERLASDHPASALVGRARLELGDTGR